MAKDTNIQMQEAEKTSNKRKVMKSVPRQIMAKFLKTRDKETILKTVREKLHLINSRKTTQMTGDQKPEKTEVLK